MKTTYKDMRLGICDSLPHVRSGTTAAFGRSWCYITCPFCHERAKTYIWSLAGGGKRCPGCGAIHTPYGNTYNRRA